MHRSARGCRTLCGARGRGRSPRCGAEARGRRGVRGLRRLHARGLRRLLAGLHADMHRRRLIGRMQDRALARGDGRRRPIRRRSNVDREDRASNRCGRGRRLDLIPRRPGQKLRHDVPGAPHRLRHGDDRSAIARALERGDDELGVLLEPNARALEVRDLGYRAGAGADRVTGEDHVTLVRGRELLTGTAHEHLS